MILIGSKASSFYYDCKVGDIDIVLGESELEWCFGLSFEGKEFLKIENVEFMQDTVLNNSSIPEDNIALRDIYIFGKQYQVAVPTPEVLWAIRRSHVHRPLNFPKHIFHLNNLKKLFNSPSEKTVSFLKERTKLTKLAYGDKVPSLNKTNEDFFDDYVTKIYNHDDIHEIVAFSDEPIYKKMKHDQSMAKCEKELWNNLSHQQKIWAVQEESMVIALERFLIPNKIRSQKIAFLKAIEKVCTTLTSGFFRDFAIDNYEECCYNIPDFVTMFNNSNIQEKNNVEVGRIV